MDNLAKARKIRLSAKAQVLQFAKSSVFVNHFAPPFATGKQSGLADCSENRQQIVGVL
jgi:hypothetical protein